MLPAQRYQSGLVLNASVDSSTSPCRRSTRTIANCTRIWHGPHQKALKQHCRVTQRVQQVASNSPCRGGRV